MKRSIARGFAPALFAMTVAAGPISAATIFDLDTTGDFAGTGVIGFDTQTGSGTSGVSSFGFSTTTPEPVTFAIAEVTEVSWSITGNTLDLFLRATTGSIVPQGSKSWELVLTTSPAQFGACDFTDVTGPYLCSVEDAGTAFFSNGYSAQLSATLSIVPLPAGLVLLLSGLAGLLALRRTARI